jgi:hypothetical protein
MGMTHQIVGALGGFFAGSMVAIEKKHRRLELGLYVFTHAIQSSWRYLIRSGVVKEIPYGEVYLFMAYVIVIIPSSHSLIHVNMI